MNASYELTSSQKIQQEVLFSILGVVDFSIIFIVLSILKRIFKIIRFTDIMLLLSVSTFLLSIILFFVCKMVSLAGLLQDRDMSQYVRVIDDWRYALFLMTLNFDLYKWTLFIFVSNGTRMRNT